MKQCGYSCHSLELNNFNVRNEGAFQHYYLAIDESFHTLQTLFRIQFTPSNGAADEINGDEAKGSCATG